MQLYKYFANDITAQQCTSFARGRKSCLCVAHGGGKRRIEPM